MEKNYFIFLYPIKEYFLSSFQKRANGFQLDFVERFNTMIEARYRSKGFRVAWLLFDSNNGESDEHDGVWGLETKKNDIFLSSGVSFREMTKSSKYANPIHVFSQISEKIEKMVLAGFHAYDCVDKLASYAYLNITTETMIDTDLTEITLMKYSFSEVPVVRTAFTFNDIYGSQPEYRVERMEKLIEEKPWIRQRPM